MDKLKKFAIGASIAWGAAKVAQYAAEQAAKGGSLKPDSPLVKYAVPLAGGGILLGAHMLNLL